MPEKDEKIADRYTILKKIGEGNIGAVYRCHDPVMDKIVAIKLLIDQTDLTSASRFHREAKATAKLDHPNIVKIIDFGEHNGQLYIVLEFCPGSSLETTNQAESLDLTQAVNIFSQIAKGMNYANQNKILHRDLKPSNIILVKGAKNNYLAKIVDFGLAKVKSEEQQLTGPGMTVGSPAYMSPEAALGETLDSRSDIFSMGCLMFETISGELPFESSNQLVSLMERVDADAASLGTIENISAPAKLVEVIDKCLNRSPNDRIQTFSELEQALEEVRVSLNDHESTYLGIKEDDNPGLSITLKDKKPQFRSSAIFAVIALSVFIVSLFPLLLLITKNNKVETSISKEDSVLPAIQYADLNVQEKVVTENGIKWISVWGASTFDDTKMLMNKKEIKNLKVIESHLDAKESDFLKTLNLQRLNLKLSYLSDYCMKNVSTNRQLEYLKLDRTSGIGIDGIKELLVCQKIKTLVLRKTSSTDDFIPIISKLSNLEIIDLSQCSKLTGKNLELLSNCKNLQEIKLVGNKLNWKNFASAVKPLKVYRLILDDTGITDGDLKHLTKIEVSILSLKRNNISADGMIVLSTNKHLTKLYVDKAKKMRDLELQEVIQSFKNCSITFSKPKLHAK